MECQASDSKKLFKVFDAAKRKKSRKKRDGLDDTNSVATDDSTIGAHGKIRSVASAKHSLQDITTAQGDGSTDIHAKRERDSSPSVSNSPAPDAHRSSRSPRRHRRPQREGLSLALKAGLVSTPRSISPPQDDDIEHLPQDQDSFIYAFLEEAIKRDKKKQRHSRRHEDRHPSRDRDVSLPREHHYHHHHHRRRRDDDITPKGKSPTHVADQTALIETFAKLCAQISDKAAPAHSSKQKELARSHSHKSLQCEVITRHDYDERPVRLNNREISRDNIASTKVRSQENLQESRTRIRSPERIPSSELLNHREKCVCCPQYERDVTKYTSKLNVVGSRMRNVGEDSYRDFPPRNCLTRSLVNPRYGTRDSQDRRDYRDYNYRRDRSRQIEEDRRRYCEQKTSRSFDVQREVYDEDRGGRRTTRSDSRKKRYEDTYREKRYDERRDKYYDDKESRDRHFTNLPSKDRRSRRNLERFEKNSVVSRDDDYRERDSGLSVADESTTSGRSNYLRVVKQEIAEQREAMDKMMKLWKELMRCFKGSSQSDKAVNEAVTMQDSAAAQLRLWRECMRRYETVARDVGDTDARLMEEITKQRSEMAEMASMWQECLQRYRDMSNDFNNLKQKLATSESPTRGPQTPLICAEGEGSIAPAPYRLPPNYPPVVDKMYGQMAQAMPAGYMGGSPLRTRASAPPWWWCGDQRARRRSSPESRASRSRERRRRKDRDEPRYNKEKSSKPTAARSEHRHRKR